MGKKHLVMLADTYRNQPIRGMWMSEKLDGMRCWWDGGISRGLLASRVPYANIRKHDRFLVAPVATGLWSRYGQPIQAPDWFLDGLPPFPLDGELYLGPGRFQDTVSIVQQKITLNGMGWREMKYMAFDLPSTYVLFADRDIDCPPNLVLKMNGCLDWALERNEFLKVYPQTSRTVANAQQAFRENWHHGCSWTPLWQEQLDASNEVTAKRQLAAKMEEVLAAGGEGVILRRNSLYWTPERCAGLLKVKPDFDAEATVIGYTFGEPGKTSRLLGRMGAAICQKPDGKVFKLSGWTDAQRSLMSKDCNQNAFEYACSHPGEDAPDWINNPFIPRGTRITYKYRELTVDGLPREARFHRLALEI